MLFATIYFANTVNAWQLCQYDRRLFMPVRDDELLCFHLQMKLREWFIPQRNTTVGYNINNY